jgi:hypothetical protein
LRPWIPDMRDPGNPVGFDYRSTEVRLIVRQAF